MRYGFTTGSCAAAAAKAAAYMLLTGRVKTEITIETPKGIPYHAKLLDIRRAETEVSCAVEKDGGDDPDITTGTLIYARVSYTTDVKTPDDGTSVDGMPRTGIDSDSMGEGTPQIGIDGTANETPQTGIDIGTVDVTSQTGIDGVVNGMPRPDTNGTANGTPRTSTNGASDGTSTSQTDDGTEDGTPRIHIDGGVGVGRVTKPGLDQPVGNAAINHVPREMIEREVREVCRIADYRGGLEIEIFVPEGERLAAQTFNPRLGIVGGISILGTSGIVEPMSSQALLDTIRTELRQRRAQGFDYVAVAPGNYGLAFMKAAYGYDLDRSVKCSNFIGATVDMAVELGFKKMLLTGHVGKLIKVAGGIMNTHSKEADCRMELLAAFSVRARVEPETVLKILDSATTEEAIGFLKESGKMQAVMENAMDRICYYLDKRAGGRLQIDCILYANEFGELAKSKEAAEWFTLLAREQEQQI